ncbi:hypothetical protein [Rickettsia rickettsii]|uniref:hypothetical protein n=1 Tax=Rickettsia rickettsii TaxID=783 RepID=UPI000039A208|nr:hypothetical protein [Rickettsia rickettsii]AFB21912.1 hypothetical protein RPN_01865 [Rickettsia rickettsii str. Brazil]AFB23869.1 hypothetical protein RPL_05175 [Rickettsia rickettsii str. Colombia]AFB25215.1 hypothetical protein RPO_05185 [Rickettsia rickettsii str. Arizona]AFB27895.1 hypothetical protein RPJ_05135 [Rickettsia rickettsii str. Hino]AFB30555.1 hypothetical protein RPM_05155 [Rickettsia rickettsii str. Hauke]
MTQNFEIVYADAMDRTHRTIIIEVLNKDAREQKGLVGDIEAFSFSCLDQDKNFVVGISGMSSWGDFTLIHSLLMKILETKIMVLY